jgi:hypothetical protein
MLVRTLGVYGERFDYHAGAAYVTFFAPNFAMIQRSCPACKSLDVRRSASVRTGGALRRFLFSMYRCRECRQLFPVRSRHSYYTALIVGCTMFIGVVGGILIARVTAQHHELPATAAQSERRFVELVRLAGNDDPVAQYRLARMYRYGDGVAQDTQEEWKWLQRAAQRGNTDAQFELGMLLREGKGVVQDFDGGLKWLRMAANAGNPDAQHELGLMYFAGRGIAEDRSAAYVWLNLAAAGGVIAAARTRDSVMRLLSPAEVAAAQAQARSLSERPPARAEPR